MRHTAIIAIVALTTASLAACSSGEAAGRAPGEPAIPATLAVAKRAPFVERYEAVGTVASKVRARSRARSWGR